MEVPFETLGPGQSGRLVYQVMGENGPITNPNRIRFMDPSSPETPTHSIVTGQYALQAGLAGAGLIASVMNLGVSAYIAAGVTALHRKIDRIEAKIDHIVKKVDRIDTQVAENNLRHAMDHMLRRSTVDTDELDLDCVAAMSGDVERFVESIPGSLFLNFSLVVSSDVRERVRQLHDLLHGIRQVVAQSYNVSIVGDPERVVTVNPDRDYFRFAHGGDLDTLVKATTVCLDEADVSSRDVKSKWYSSNFVDQFEAMGLTDLDNYLPQRHSEIFQETYDSDSFEETQQRLGELVRAWLFGADAGLFFRTSLEMQAMSDGYEEVFWPELQGKESCEIGQIFVACEIPSR